MCGLKWPRQIVDPFSEASLMMMGVLDSKVAGVFVKFYIMGPYGKLFVSSRWFYGWESSVYS